MIALSNIISASLTAMAIMAAAGSKALSTGRLNTKKAKRKAG